MTVHKSSLIPGISKFIDESVLSHYPPTSMKRILMAGAVSLYLKQSEGMVDSLSSNPIFTSLGITSEGGMIDLDVIRDALKKEIKKAGFVRITVPFIGDIDFTSDDVDTLYKLIAEANNTKVADATPPQSVYPPVVNTVLGSSTGVY
jgi:hypothetical protein